MQLSELRRTLCCVHNDVVRVDTSFVWNMACKFGMRTSTLARSGLGGGAAYCPASAGSRGACPAIEARHVSGRSYRKRINSQTALLPPFGASIKGREQPCAEVCNAWHLECVSALSKCRHVRAKILDAQLSQVCSLVVSSGPGF